MDTRTWTAPLLITVLLALFGGSIAMAKLDTPPSQVVVANTAEHPRNGEGDIIRLERRPAAGLWPLDEERRRLRPGGDLEQDLP